MKSFILVALGVVLATWSVFADSKPNQPISPAPTNKGTIPIFIKRGKHSPQKYAPSIGISITATITENGMAFDFPFPESDYPMTVELELLSEPYGFWTTTFMDSSSCVLDLDVSVGDYHVTVVNSEGIEYSGHFTLE